MDPLPTKRHWWADSGKISCLRGWITNIWVLKFSKWIIYFMSMFAHGRLLGGTWVQCIGHAATCDWCTVGSKLVISFIRMFAHAGYLLACGFNVLAVTPRGVSPCLCGLVISLSFDIWGCLTWRGLLGERKMERGRGRGRERLIGIRWKWSPRKEQLVFLVPLSCPLQEVNVVSFCTFS